MKELILWKEVDVKDELPQTEDYVPVILSNKAIAFDCYVDGDWWINDKEKTYPTTHWLKRIVMPILDDKELDRVAMDYVNHTEYPQGFYSYRAGYKLSQERLIGGQGL